MNYNQIQQKIKRYALSLPYVNSSNLGDIYEYLNGNPDVKYASVNIDITSSTRNDNLTAYNVYLYYVDRLTQDKSNHIEIKTTAEQVLNSIVNYTATFGDVNDGWTIQFFEQQFSDYCAGGYVQYNLEVPNIMGECILDTYEDEGEIIDPTKPEYSLIDDTVIVSNKTWSSFKINEDLNNKQDKLIAGDNITIENNVISAAGGQYELPIATRNTLGGVIIGNGVNITDAGVLSCDIAGVSPITVAREVPSNRFLVGVLNATKSHKGVVKIGDGLNVSNDGTISVPLPDLSNYLQQGSNQLTSNLKFFGKDGVSNITINDDHADFVAQSLHKVSGTDEFDRGIFYKFTPDNINFQNATTDVDGNIGSVTSEYKQTTKTITLAAEKITMRPSSAFEVYGTMNVIASDKTTKFDNNKIEAKVQNTFTIKDGSNNKIFETKSNQTKINNRLDVIEPERGNTLSLRKDAFETKVSGSSGVSNWQKMSAGGNPFAFGVESDSNINNGDKTSLLNTLPNGSIFVYGVGGYDGLSTAGNRSLQTVVSDLETEIYNLQDNKQDVLVAGTGINISGNVISAAGEVAILTKNAQIRITVYDFTKYDVISIFVSTSVDRYQIYQYRDTTLSPSQAIAQPFDFDIQYTNADPRVNVMVYNGGGGDSTQMGRFWVDYYSFRNAPNQIVPLGFWDANNNYQYKGFSVIGSLKDYDLSRDGRIELFSVQTSTMCYAEDTLITLSDGTTKMVQDITYDDVLKVWNFDEGKSGSAKPIWIKVEQTAKQYALVKLSDGNSIKLVGSDGKYHCMFDMDEQKFNHAIDCIGHNVYTENGIAKVESLEIFNEPVKFYNIVTNVHLNCYANHILTSTEKNNIYQINDMKFIKDNRTLKSYDEFKDYGISLDDYNGWRLAEQPMSVEECVEFIKQRKQTQH